MKPWVFFAIWFLAICVRNFIPDAVHQPNARLNTESTTYTSSNNDNRPDDTNFKLFSVENAITNLKKINRRAEQLYDEVAAIFDDAKPSDSLLEKERRNRHVRAPFKPVPQEESYDLSSDVDASYCDDPMDSFIYEHRMEDTLCDFINEESDGVCNLHTQNEHSDNHDDETAARTQTNAGNNYIQGLDEYDDEPLCVMNSTDLDSCFLNDEPLCDMNSTDCIYNTDSCFLNETARMQLNEAVHNETSCAEYIDISCNGHGFCFTEEEIQEKEARYRTLQSEQRAIAEEMSYLEYSLMKNIQKRPPSTFFQVFTRLISMAGPIGFFIRFGAMVSCVSVFCYIVHYITLRLGHEFINNYNIFNGTTRTSRRRRRKKQKTKVPTPCANSPEFSPAALDAHEPINLQTSNSVDLEREEPIQ